MQEVMMNKELLNMWININIYQLNKEISIDSENIKSS